MGESAVLNRIMVRKLFGSRTYDIDLNEFYPTVLTGANGTGKSTILRLVNAVSNGDLRTLLTAPVDQLVLNFNRMPPFILTKHPKKVTIESGANIHELPALPSLKDTPDRIWGAVNYVLDRKFSGAKPGRNVEHILMNYYEESGLPYDQYREILRALSKFDLGAFEFPDWFAELRTSFPVLFITDQRLVVEPSRMGKKYAGSNDIKNSRLAVEAASNHISSAMQRADSDYARASQTQDRRFPRDVLHAMREKRAVTDSQLARLIEQVDNRRSALLQVGLLDMDSSFEPILEVDSLANAEVRPVIATFLRSSLRKLQVLEDISRRLQAFKSFLDSRFSAKKMEFNRGEGFHFRLPSGAVIQPAQLSSGEQQMLVLAYEILFKAEPGTLVIIDEPEISLHVLWQDALIDNLNKMGGPSNLQFLMATHSPTILASHPETERSLDEGQQDA
ncbi:AAA family ATPase [Actinosynnema sp. NPDC059797]